MLKYLKCLLPYMTVSKPWPLINYKNYRIKKNQCQNIKKGIQYLVYFTISKTLWLSHYIRHLQGVIYQKLKNIGPVIHTRPLYKQANLVIIFVTH